MPEMLHDEALEVQNSCKLRYSGSAVSAVASAARAKLRGRAAVSATSGSPRTVRCSNCSASR